MRPNSIGPLEQRKQPITTLRIFVSFTVSEEEFAVDIGRVREVIRLPSLTVVPNVPDFVEGIIHLRGRIVPVIDLRKRLRIANRPIKPTSKYTRVMIISFEGKWTGFIVDAVTEVLRIPQSHIKPPPDILVKQVGGEFFEGVIQLGGRILIILNIPKLLSPEEQVQLKTIDFDNIRGFLAEASSTPTPP